MTSTISAECKQCRGTGLYTGLGEKDGMAVVCSNCRGTGEYWIIYLPFTGQKTRDDVTRVVQTNPGIRITPEITQGGVSYQEWQQDPGSVEQRGREVREHYCPAWWYQSADSNKQPKWTECQKVSSFPKCPLFHRKEECWKRFDQEQLENSRP